MQDLGDGEQGCEILSLELDMIVAQQLTEALVICKGLYEINVVKIVAWMKSLLDPFVNQKALDNR